MTGKHHSCKDCIHYNEKFYDEYECGYGKWYWELSCDVNGEVESVGICEDFEEDTGEYECLNINDL